MVPAPADDHPEASVPARNHLELTAILSERETLRYNLSGVPVVECVLTHESILPEAGIDRRVNLRVQAVAIGDVAHRLVEIDPGTRLSVSGFLAQARKSTRIVCLHLTRIDPY